MMTEALTYLDRAEEWELVVRCYNFLGIASMSRGNPSLALDYYMNGLKDSDTYDLPMQKIMILINMGLLYLECGHYADSENSFLEAYQILQTKQKDEKYNFYMYAFYVFNKSTDGDNAAVWVDYFTHIFLYFILAS